MEIINKTIMCKQNMHYYVNVTSIISFEDDIFNYLVDYTLSLVNFPFFDLKLLAS